MTSHEVINPALDALNGEAGTVEAVVDSGCAEVDVVAVGGLGVKVRRVRFHRNESFDLAEESEQLPQRIRSLPHRLQPVEVDPVLGGSVLRSRPEEMRRGDFFQVDLHGTREIEVRRIAVGHDGARSDADFTMTREQLGDLIDELS